VRRALAGLVAGSGAALAAALLAGGEPTGLRIALGVPLVLLLPGLAISLGLFPRRFSWPDGLFLVLALSVASGAVLGVAFSYLPGRLDRHVWVAIYGSVALAGGLGAALRRPPALRPSRPTLAWRRLVTVAALIAALGLVAAGMVLARTPLAASDVRGYTSLWIQRGGAGPGSLRVGFTSFEAGPRIFRLELVRAGRVAFARKVFVRPGRTWQRTFTLSDNLDSRVEARLSLESHGVLYRRVVLVPVPGRRADSAGIRSS